MDVQAIREHCVFPERGQHRAFRNITEAISAVMYWLLSEFRDGDNVVTTTMNTTPTTCRGMR